MSFHRRLWGFTKRLYTYVYVCTSMYVCMQYVSIMCLHVLHLILFVCTINICRWFVWQHSSTTLTQNYLLIINHPSFEHFLTIWHPSRPSAQRKLINSTYKHTLRSFTFACKQNKWEYFLTLIIHATCFCFVAVTVTVVCVCVCV